MGVSDRDYYRQSPARSGLGQMQGWSATTWLIIVNFAFLALDQFLVSAGVSYIDPFFRPIMGLCYFSPDIGLFKWELWRAITFSFVHMNIVFLLINTVMLFVFGPVVESYLGSRRRFLGLYLLSGLGGAAVLTILSLLKIVGPLTPLIGSTPAVFGVLAAAGRTAPNATVLIGGMVPVQLRTLAWTLLAVVTVVLFNITYTDNSNQLVINPPLPHLGGALIGLILISNPQWLRFVDFDPSRRQPPF